MSIDKTQAHSRGRIVRSTSILAAGTFASRVLGFVRDVLFARFFGTTAVADAFLVAFRVPNLFRDLLGEGAANSSFIPVMAEYREKKPGDLSGFLNSVLAWAFLVLTAVSVAGIIFAPVIVKAIAPGFLGDPAKFREAVDLTRVMFPYLIFIGLTAFLSAIQFTCGRFVMPAFGPCLLNVTLIVSMLLSIWKMDHPVYGMASGVVVGGILQFYFQWVPVKRMGFDLRRAFRLFHPGARQVGKLLLPRLLGSGVYQLNIFVDTICASLVSVVGAGGISALFYANRIVQFPMGIFGIALASAALPAFSAHAASGDREEFRKTVAFVLENIFFIMLPMTVFLCLMSREIVDVIFRRGAFGDYSAAITSSALFFSGLGLMGYGGGRVMTAAFHALQDTRTPVKAAAVCLAVNASLNVTLMFPMKIAGIALASAAASVFNVGILFYLLRKRLGGLGGGMPGFCVKIAAAALLEAALMIGAKQLFPLWPGLVRLGFVFVVGMSGYFAVAFLLRVPQAVNAGTFLRRRLPRG